MGKPKKREVQEGRFEAAKFETAMWNDGYNQCWDEYEAWLKEAISVDKIKRVIEMFDMQEMYGSELAKAIFNLTKQEG